MTKTAAPKKPATRGPLSLKVTLRNTKPPIWRRLLVSRGMTLEDLHIALQIAMGWQHSHLHDFDVGGERYGDPGTTEDVANERRVTLNTLVKSGITHFDYTYDFGDNWEHRILIEKTVPLHTATAYPACIAGKRHCPPEDCGGTWGYDELLEILADPAHPQHEEQLEWLGGSFDPDAFSVAETDAMLAAAFGRKTPPS